MNYLNIEPKAIENTTKKLNQLLSDYQVYYQNLRRYHWTISGENFFDLHEKFEDLYNDAKVQIDEIAERILTLRNTPIGKMSEYLKISNVKEIDAKTSREMVTAVLENHRIVIQSLRNVIKEANQAEDEGTIDLLSSFLSSLEKKSWMLDAWLKKS